MAKKKVTLESLAKNIDDLAIITKKGFDDVNSRFGEVNSRFDGVNSRFDGVEERLTDLENGQEQIRNIIFKEMERLDEHGIRIKNLEAKI